MGVVTVIAATGGGGGGGVLRRDSCTNSCLSFGVAKVLDITEHNVTWKQ